MINPSILSSYQNPGGQLKDRLAPRTLKRLENLEWLSIVQKRTVLDLGCNNGYFTREALRRGARRAVGVDESNAILGARELATQEGSKAEFWQTDIDSKEFRRFCPKFEVVFLLSVLTHVRDKEEFLDWLDGICTYALVFESNHGEKNKEHIELVKKHLWFESIIPFGATDVPEKPHYLWVCRKWQHDIRYPAITSAELQWIPLEDIRGWNEGSLVNQAGGYGLDSERFRALLEDIKTRGIRDPILLRRNESGDGLIGWQGAHRFFAAKMLGYKEVPCKVFSGRYATK